MRGSVSRKTRQCFRCRHPPFSLLCHSDKPPLHWAGSGGHLRARRAGWSSPRDGNCNLHVTSIHLSSITIDFAIATLAVTRVPASRKMPSFVFKRQSSEIKCHIRLSYKQSNSVQAPITGPPWCKETFEMWTYKVPHRCISGPASPAAATLGMPGLSSEQTVIGIVLVCARPHHHPRICRRSFGTLAQPRPPPSPHRREWWRWCWRQWRHITPCSSNAGIPGVTVGNTTALMLFCPKGPHVFSFYLFQECIWLEVHL